MPQKLITFISNEYKKQIQLPRIIKPQFILCPVGNIGAGKSTVMKPLCKQLHVVRLEADGIRKILKEHGKSYDAVKDILFFLAEHFLSEGYRIGIDSNCGSDASQPFLKKLFKKFPLPVFWIFVNPPEEFIIKKLKTYPHSWLFNDADHALKNYFFQKQNYEQKKFSFVYTFDPSQLNLDIQISEAVSLINNSFKRNSN